jgi:hypothetical protein
MSFDIFSLSSSDSLHLLHQSSNRFWDYISLPHSLLDNILREYSLKFIVVLVPVSLCELFAFLQYANKRSITTLLCSCDRLNDTHATVPQARALRTKTRPHGIHDVL